MDGQVFPCRHSFPTGSNTLMDHSQAYSPGSFWNMLTKSPQIFILFPVSLIGDLAVIIGLRPKGEIREDLRSKTIVL